jgi:hypothetical protein
MVASYMDRALGETPAMPPPQSEEPIEEADLERLQIWYNGEDGNDTKPEGLELPEAAITYVDHSNDEFRVSYTASADEESTSPSVAIFYDTDTEDFDGTLLEECLSLNETGISVMLDSSDVSSGTYYLYVCVFDGDNVTCNYASDSVRIQRFLDGPSR